MGVCQPVMVIEDKDGSDDAGGNHEHDCVEIGCCNKRVFFTDFKNILGCRKVMIDWYLDWIFRLLDYCNLQERNEILYVGLFTASRLHLLRPSCTVINKLWDNI